MAAELGVVRDADGNHGGRNAGATVAVAVVRGRRRRRRELVLVFVLFLAWVLVLVLVLIDPLDDPRVEDLFKDVSGGGGRWHCCWNCCCRVLLVVMLLPQFPRGRHRNNVPLRMVKRKEAGNQERWWKGRRQRQRRWWQRRSVHRSVHRSVQQSSTSIAHHGGSAGRRTVRARTRTRAGTRSRCRCRCGCCWRCRCCDSSVSIVPQSLGPGGSLEHESVVVVVNNVIVVSVVVRCSSCSSTSSTIIEVVVQAPEVLLVGVVGHNVLGGLGSLQEQSVLPIPDTVNGTGLKGQRNVVALPALEFFLFLVVAVVVVMFVVVDAVVDAAASPCPGGFMVGFSGVRFCFGRR
mmetsp:Transcript_2257/g.6054  ORF Transcript_2257/g.6054 Transcript_2257/m.6054 type:complete len:348 (+) Transcript_2257:2-1045(+)